MKINIPLILLAVLLAFFGFLPKAWSVSPAPDGGYPNLTTAEGQDALFSLSTGAANTAVGWLSLRSVTTGSFNTGIGAATLVLNTGDNNTATGTAALLLNTTGTNNTANGTATLVNNSAASDNTAVGAFALNNNIGDSASGNTAVGSTALFSNTIGSANTATGFGALSSNTEGSANTANGQNALQNNLNGGDNTAVGQGALFNNISGGANTAIGEATLQLNSAGSFNTAVGNAALVGATGSNNIAIGFQAGSKVGSSGNVIAIGSPGDDTDNTCFIGNIRDVQTQNADAIGVVVDSAGQLGTVSSSRRFKEQIKPMDKASEAVLALKPVTFRYKNAKKGTPQFGLIAEEVAEVNPDLVVRDKNGEIYTVRYDAVNAMLVNEFLKAHRKMQEQQRQIDLLTAQLKQQGAQIQKVSAQMEVSRPTRQLARSSN
jgi:Chaperone of endosialidase